MTVQDAAAIKMSINRAAGYLESQQKLNGSVHLEGALQYQVWETANALLAILEVAPEKKDFLREASAFLRKHRGSEGAFCRGIPNKPGRHCMETTPIGLLGLAKMGEDVNEGIHFILCL